ncbi:MAG: hypothetical protein RJB39_732 [Candidatus Parcubacteria bacterium]
MTSYWVTELFETGFLTEDQILDLVDPYIESNVVNRKCTVELTALKHIALEPKSIVELITLCNRWKWNTDSCSAIKILILERMKELSPEELLALGPETGAEWHEWRLIYKALPDLGVLTDEQYAICAGHYAFWETEVGRDAMRAQLNIRFTHDRWHHLPQATLIRFMIGVGKVNHKDNPYRPNLSLTDEFVDVIDLTKLPPQEVFDFVTWYPRLWKDVARIVDCDKLNDEQLMAFVHHTESKRAQTLLFGRLSVHSKTPTELVALVAKYNWTFVRETVVEELSTRDMPVAEWVELARSAKSLDVWKVLIEESDITPEELVVLGMEIHNEKLWALIVPHLVALS